MKFAYISGEKVRASSGASARDGQQYDARARTLGD